METQKNKLHSSILDFDEEVLKSCQNIPLLEKIVSADPMFYRNNLEIFTIDYLLLEECQKKAYVAVSNEGLLTEEYREESETKIDQLLNEILSTMVENYNRIETENGKGVVKINNAYFESLLEKYFGIVSDKRLQEVNNSYWEELNVSVLGTISVAKYVLDTLGNQLDVNTKNAIEEKIADLEYAYSQADTSYVEQTVKELRQLVYPSQSENIRN